MTSAGPVDLHEVARQAEATLPHDVWDFIAGGSGGEITMAANRAALDRVALRPRVLAGGGGGVDLGCTLVRSESAMPVATAPMAYQRLAHPDGELALAEAAKLAGIPYTAATLSSVRLEEIAEVGAELWFQLYWLRDLSIVDNLVARAENAGCTALMLTVDVPILGRRLRDVRNGFALPDDLVAANLVGSGTRETTGSAPAGGSAFASHTAAILDPTLSWAHLDRLRTRTTLPVVLKGIMHPDDARTAIEHGVDALVVSNHGGRQLDGTQAGVDALPDVVAAVDGRVPVLFDSGVRGGVDVLRALAIGASGVLLGRPLLYGLAIGGAAGAARVLDLLRGELADAMTIAGCANPAAARTIAAPTAASTGDEGP